MSHILAHARALQERHGPGVLDAALRWLGAQFTARASTAPAASRRQMVLH